MDARKDAEERARRAEDLSVNARTRFKEWDDAKAALEDELAAVRKESAAEKEKASARQLELHERVVRLTDQLSEARARVGDVDAMAKAPAEAKKMEEAARRLRRDLAAAERVRFAANMVAAGAREEVTTAAAMEGSDDALAEVAAAGGVVGSRRADALAEMAAQMASMREELAALRAVKTREAAAAAAAAPPKAPPKAPPGPHESRPFAPVASDKENSPGACRVRPDADALAAEVTTLRTQLDLANSTIGVLRETRDQAMLSHMRFARPDYNPAPLLGPSAFGAAYPPPPPPNFSTPAVTPTPSGWHPLAPPPTAPPTAPPMAPPHPVPVAGQSTPFPPGSNAERAYLHPDLVAARAEADRIVAQAEARGRESLVRLEAMAARLERPPALDLGVKEATREGGEVEEEEEAEGAWGKKRETPSRRGDY